MPDVALPREPLRACDNVEDWAGGFVGGGGLRRRRRVIVGGRRVDEAARQQLQVAVGPGQRRDKKTLAAMGA